MKPTEVIKKWIDEGCDYDEGITLHNNYGTNRGLKLLFPGKKARYHDKLVAELCKVAGLDYHKLKPKIKYATAKPAIVLSPPAMQKVVEEKIEQRARREEQMEKEGVVIEDAKLQTYPPPVIKLIEEYSRLYNHRSILHRNMRELPETNDNDTVKLRAAIFEEVKQASARLELFYEAKQAFFADGTLPNEKLLWPDEDPEIEEEQLPGNVEELKRLKKQLQVNNAKDRNRLDYQSDTKSAVKRPMQPGPKRAKIEKRMGKRNQLIEKIDWKLNELM